VLGLDQLQLDFRPPTRNRSVIDVRTLSWQEKIEAARAPQEIVSIVRDYLASHHYEIARLPAACRPSSMVDAADVGAYTLALVRHHVDVVGRKGDFVHRLTAVMVLANTKISRVLATTNDSDGAVEDTA